MFSKDDVSRLEEEVKNLKAESATLKSSLKRESLRFDNLKNENDELKNANAEFKRSVADLKRQVDNWQNLGNKEGAETEKLRKERITFEVKFQEMETRNSELTEEMELREAKIEKFRVRLRDYVVRFGSRSASSPLPELRTSFFAFLQKSDKESRGYIEDLEETCQDLRQEVATFKENVVKLRAALSTAQQEIKIHNTVEQEHRVGLSLVPGARCLMDPPE